MNETKNGCAKIKRLLEPYFEGALPSRQGRMVAGHLWQCPQCAAEVEQIQRLAQALESLPRMEPSVALLRSISTGLATVPTPAERRRLSQGWRQVVKIALLVMAAMAAIGSTGVLVAAASFAAALPVVPFLGAVIAKLGVWTEAMWRMASAVILAMGSVPSAILEAGKAVAPTLLAYTAAELVFMIAVVLVIRRTHFRAGTSPGTGARRA
jgi:anti-sigma factor RsiW